MTFDDILAQVIDLLQRQGRLSYGAIKRRFGLDDAYVDDLKDELIHAQRVATDEDGKVLVWMGTSPEPTAVSAPSVSQESVPPPTLPPDAERRQLTVMFCDLVDSTKLSSTVPTGASMHRTSALSALPIWPDPVSPFTFSMFMEALVEGGWCDALVEMGAFTHDEFAAGRMETLGVFGSYCYLNASVTRIFGERAPGLSAQAMDDLFFGAQPGIPPYEPAPGDQNEARTAAIGATFTAVMSADRLQAPAASVKLVD
jgi:hypothetical protein